MYLGLAVALATWYNEFIRTGGWAYEGRKATHCDHWKTVRQRRQ